jgi:hypothetical protein
MKLYDVSFFCSKDNETQPTPLRFNAHYNDQETWPVSIRITSDDYFGKPSITFHLTSVEELIKFRESVNEACVKVILESIAARKSDD